MARPSSSHDITITRGASPTAIGQPRSRFVAVLSAVLLVVACVAMAGSLGGRAGGAGSALDESEEYLRVPRRLANLAADSAFYLENQKAGRRLQAHLGHNDIIRLPDSRGLVESRDELRTAAKDD